MRRNAAWIALGAVLIVAGAVRMVHRGVGMLRDPSLKLSQYQSLLPDLPVAFQYPEGWRLQEELGTHPKVIYLREAKWRE